MSNRTSTDAEVRAPGGAWDRCREAGIPWLAAGMAVGALVGAGAGSLAWGLGVGAAAGLALQQTYGRKKPAGAR